MEHCRGDRIEREPLVDLTRQTADAHGADTVSADQDRDTPEEEREERVEARQLGRSAGNCHGATGFALIIFGQRRGRLMA